MAAASSSRTGSANHRARRRPRTCTPPYATLTPRVPTSTIGFVGHGRHPQHKGTSEPVRRLAELQESGFVLARGMVDTPGRERLLALCDPECAPSPVRNRSGTAYAARGLLWNVPGLTSELTSCGLDALAAAALGRAGFPVDAIFFDKQPLANWAVPGHQDRMMPVASEGAGTSHVRVRDGIPYVEPSEAVLAELVALRLHFDACNEDSGALCVVADSHRRGVLGDREVREVPMGSYRACPAAAGDVLVLRPLILHRSSPSRLAVRRRVLHVVYAADPLTNGLQWRRG